MSQKPTRKQLRSIRQEANEIFGNRKLEKQWMQTPLRVLGGIAPSELKKTREGADRMHILLQQIKYGVYI